MQKGLLTRLTIHEILKKLKNNYISFDQIFEIKVSQKKFSSNAYILLLSATTQLIILNFKDFAVINSTVELTKVTTLNVSTNFINGTLRNINRNKKKLLKLKYEFSQLPSWFVKRVSYWSNKQKKEFVKTILMEPSLHLVFKNKKDIKNFAPINIQTTNNSIAVQNSTSFQDILKFKKGIWWVQDFATMMPLYLTNNIKNKITADLCAAPGGKLFQLINYGAKVIAYEKNIHKAQLMKQGLSRLNLDCEVVIKDALKIEDNKKFDLIVLDAPCTAIGTIRRNPEIFFRKQAPNLSKVTVLQSELLKKAKKLLNKNGIIIYMVCSFFPEEGELQVLKFLNNNKNFSLLKFTPNNNKDAKYFITKKGFFYVLPSKLKNGLYIDGFFAAKLKNNDK